MIRPTPEKRVFKFPGGAVLTCGTDWFLNMPDGGFVWGYHVRGGLGPSEVEFITLEGDTLEQQRQK